MLLYVALKKNREVHDDRRAVRHNGVLVETRFGSTPSSGRVLRRFETVR